MPTELTTSYSAALEAQSLAYWIAARAEALSGGTNNVTSLTDLSGNNLDFTNAVVGGGAASLIDSPAPDRYGFVAAQSDAYGHAAGVPGMADLWAVLVGYPAGDCVWMSGAAASYIGVFGTSGEMRFHDGVTLLTHPITLEPGELYVFTWQRDAGDVRMSADKAATFTQRNRGGPDAAGAELPAWTRLGYYGPGGTNFWNGHAVEFWITTNAPPDDADSIVIAMLKANGLLGSSQAIRRHFFRAG